MNTAITKYQDQSNRIVNVRNHIMKSKIVK